VIEVLTNYFRYQLRELPKTPLGHWTFWGNRRGADNLLVVYWLYNITGEPFLLELGRLIHEQTHPYTEIFLERGDIESQGPFNEAQWTAKDATAYPFHCVNLAQGIKAPIVYSQYDQDPKYLQAVTKAFDDLKKYHGQPHGLFGGDEALHGRQLTRGSELCTAVEMMFSLETMLEITGDPRFADRLEEIAFNVLPSQISDDCQQRQYFQLANQVMVTHGVKNFYNNEPDRMVFGLLAGYPCCTCNLHQAWPKFSQRLWLATPHNGLAALIYAPSKVTAKVGESGETVTITERTDYPFREQVAFDFEMSAPNEFPFKLRIPGWCVDAQLHINGASHGELNPGQIVTLERTWTSGDQVVLTLPMQLTTRRGHENSVSLHRGPLVFALRIEEDWQDRGAYQEVLPQSPWNFALLEESLEDLKANFSVQPSAEVSSKPWSLAHAPLSIETKGVRLPDWKIYNDMAGPIPWSPQARPVGSQAQPITLVPYGCTTLRISGFPTVN
ncbi:MAG: beta-L-arabinofuranosidase domain-containing protein, partial [Planctomycetota bacterium]